MQQVPIQYIINGKLCWNNFYNDLSALIIECSHFDVTFVGNDHGNINIGFDAIPETAKNITPYFAQYSVSTVVDINLTVIKASDKWVIGYYNRNSSFTARIGVWYTV